MLFTLQINTTKQSTGIEDKTNQVSFAIKEDIESQDCHLYHKQNVLSQTQFRT